MRYYKLADALKNKEQTTALNLSFSYKEVSELPKEILDFPNLEELNIYYGKIIELPEWIGQLQHLKTLTVQSCQLVSIPESIGQLKKLAYLSLGYNQLRSLPKSIGQLRQLLSLNLRSNFLQELPESIGQLRKLQTLFLQSNQLKSLPEGIGNLVELPELLISSNELTYLPESIGNLSKLSRVHLYRNKLVALPESIGQLEQLSHLNLSYNKLTSLPDSLPQCTKLSRIDLAHNQLEVLPDNLFQVPTLKNLNLSQNKLSTLPNNITKATQLTYLNLSYNGLETLASTGWENLTSLTSLYLSNNKINSFPTGLEQAPNLSILNIANNPFIEPPLAVLKLPKLKNLAAYNTKLHPAFVDPTASQKILSEFQKQATPFDYRVSTYNILCSPKDKITQFSLAHIFEALRIRYKPLQEKVQATLFAQYKEAYQKKPLQKGSELVILGTINFKKTEVKERLKALDIQYRIKIKPSTTHVVVGFNIKKYDGYKQEGLVFISEQDLNDYFINNEEQYLLEESEDGSNNTEHVAMLLSSTDHQNIDLAFQILRTGGVPQDLITELFLIAKNPKLPKRLRQQARAYITLHGSEKLNSKIKTHKMIFPGYINENKHTRNIKYYTEGTELDGVKVGKYIYTYTRQGLKFWFEQMTKAQRKEAIDILAQDATFVLSARFFKDKEEVFEYTNVQGLELTSRRLAKLPENLFKFKQLKRLSLSRNRLTSLPKELAQLQQLQWLNIAYNKIPDFPKVLDEMPQLKEIIVSSNGFAIRNNKDISQDLYDFKHFPYSLYRK